MNKQLLEHYIEAYGTDIYSFCIRLTQNREQAEELYQDTFLATVSYTHLTLPTILRV